MGETPGAADDTTQLTEVLDVFTAEAEERLAAMEEGLLRLETRTDDEEAVALVFRSAHTLKGNAGSLGFGAVAALAHVLEDVLQDLSDKRFHVTSEAVTLLLHSVDSLRELMARGAGAELDDAHRRLIQRLAGFHSTGAEIEPAKPTTLETRDHWTPHSVPIDRTLRVDLTRLDQLLSLTGEIAIARSRLSQMIISPDTTRRGLQGVIRESERLYLDLQDLVMKLRMVPVGPSFQQLARAVRDVSKTLAKEARLDCSGGDVEIDSTVLQLLRDPLTHMIRNSLDHGIEPPSVRERLGKPRVGRISLSCSRETGHVLIQLADDGAGIDRERVIARARERGLISEDFVPPESQLFSLLFEPGFSTSRAVSDISGRGVGLDVVRRNVHALRGSVAIASQTGQGTTLSIRLPLTLAIIEGLLVHVGDTTYIMPLEDMLESRSMPAEETAREEGHGVVNLRNKPLPYLRLRHIFHSGPPPGREVLIVVKGRAGPVGLVVDTVSSQGQIVIKPLSKVFQGVRGVAATTVLANGQVALILDVDALLEADDASQKEASVARGA